MHRELHHRATVGVRVPRYREGFWAIIQKLAATQGEFSVSDIDDESNVDASHIRKFMRALTAGGYVVVTRHEIRHNGRVPIYKLVKPQRQVPSVRADGTVIAATMQERLWTAIRNLKSFSMRELIFAATTDDAPSQRCARLFVMRLVSAGYLSAEGDVPSIQMFRLKPKMNTGPKPPQRLRICGDVMFDPNTLAIVGDDLTAEVAA